MVCVGGRGVIFELGTLLYLRLLWPVPCLFPVSRGTSQDTTIKVEYLEPFLMLSPLGCAGVGSCGQEVL